MMAIFITFIILCKAFSCPTKKKKNKHLFLLPTKSNTVNCK